MSKGVSLNSINSNEKTVKKNIATMKCMKRQLFPDENIAKKLKCTNTTEKYSSEMIVHCHINNLISAVHSHIFLL